MDLKFGSAWTGTTAYSYTSSARLFFLNPSGYIWGLKATFAGLNVPFSPFGLALAGSPSYPYYQITRLMRSYGPRLSYLTLSFAYAVIINEFARQISIKSSKLYMTEMAIF